MDHRLRALGEQALAPSTRVRYRRCFATFLRVTEGQGVGSQAQMGTRVQQFIVWARELGKSHAWVSRHMAAIAYITKLAGQADPTSNFPVRAALRGWARGEPKQATD